MAWTPHTQEQLTSAGVKFGTGDSISGSPVIVYPNSDGTTGGYYPNYGGTPMNISTGTAGSGLSSLNASLSQGFQGLQNLIMKNTDKNNAFSAAQAQKQMDFQERMNSIAMDFNSLEAAKNRNWQEVMSNTAHQREIADLKAAGLNPVLSATGGNGAAVGSGATAQGVTSSGAMAEADTSGNAATASLYGALINAQTQMYNADLTAKTNMYMADRQAAAAMYGAQLAAETARTNNPTQLLTTLVDAMLGDKGADSGDRGSGIKAAGNTISIPIDVSKEVIKAAANPVSYVAENGGNTSKMDYRDAKREVLNLPIGDLIWKRYRESP